MIIQGLREIHILLRYSPLLRLYNVFENDLQVIATLVYWQSEISRQSLCKPYLIRQTLFNDLASL